MNILSPRFSKPLNITSALTHSTLGQLNVARSSLVDCLEKASTQTAPFLAYQKTKSLTDGTIKELAFFDFPTLSGTRVIASLYNFFHQHDDEPMLHAHHYIRTAIYPVEMQAQLERQLPTALAIINNEVNPFQFVNPTSKQGILPEVVRPSCEMEAMSSFSIFPAAKAQISHKTADGILASEMEYTTATPQVLQTFFMNKPENEERVITEGLYNPLANTLEGSSADGLNQLIGAVTGQIKLLISAINR